MSRLRFRTCEGVCSQGAATVPAVGLQSEQMIMSENSDDEVSDPSLC